MKILSLIFMGLISIFSFTYATSYLNIKLSKEKRIHYFYASSTSNEVVDSSNFSNDGVILYVSNNRALCETSFDGTSVFWINLKDLSLDIEDDVLITLYESADVANIIEGYDVDSTYAWMPGMSRGTIVLEKGYPYKIKDLEKGFVYIDSIPSKSYGSNNKTIYEEGWVYIDELYRYRYKNDKK